ncbi:MAG: ArsR family transcriptional regulator [Bacteroidetes bacterium]|nr:ArsR family transcriptional regulator [Bacteroidota bacterium]
MLEALITSKTRIKLLLKFFLNPNTSAYLRGLSSEFGESSNAVRLELNRLEQAGMIEATSNGNKKMFQVNKKHPLFGSIQQIVMKYVGIDEIIQNVIRGLGNLEAAYMAGDLARGMDSNIIDLVLIGDINREYLSTTIEKAQTITNKKIRYLIYDELEATDRDFNATNYLLIWSKSK